MSQFENCRSVFVVAFLSGSLLAAGTASAQYYGNQGGGNYAQQYVDQYENACLNGDEKSCQELFLYANGLCNRGDRSACNYAGQVAQFVLGQRGQDQRPQPGGYGPQPGYQPQLPPYRGDPLTPGQHNTIKETMDYIKSKCNDPVLAPQLQYCR